MKIACYVDPERQAKTAAVLEDFRYGCGGNLIYKSEPVGAQHHVVMGMWSGAETLIKTFTKQGVDYFHIDNGWLQGSPLNTTPDQDRYYRITRNGMAPKLLKDCLSTRAERLGVKIEPWKTEDELGSLVMVILSSDRMGRPWGVDQNSWLDHVWEQIHSTSDRKIYVRPKPTSTKDSKLKPFLEDLNNAWCLVTHTSSTAVQAVLAGIPAFCEPTNAAFPMASNDYTKIESPVHPEGRREWINSLTWQQFTRAEMRSGMMWAMAQEFLLHD